MFKYWRATAACAAACAVVATGAGPAFAQPALVPIVSVTISAKAHLAKLDGYTAVQYKAGKYGRVTISGSVTQAASGMEAQLLAQPFPYTAAAAPVQGQTLVLNGTTPQSYSFVATPAIATKYSVEILQSTLSSTVEATSSAATVYVVTEQSVVTKP